MLSELLWVGLMFSLVLTGVWIGWYIWKRRKHFSGKLLIDTTGDKDRWTIFFDDDLGDIEKMTEVVLSIEKRVE